jgi:hypothetical protein
MAGSFSNYQENASLDAIFGSGSPTNCYFALFTALSADGTSVTEVSGGSYARKLMTNNSTNFPAASSGSKSNGVAITFATPTADWGEVVGFGVYDASSGGNLLCHGFLGNDAGKIFTAATSDVFTCPGHGFSNTNKVRVLAAPGGTLPTGISEGTTYFVISVSGDTFSLSLTSGGAAVDVTAAGAGVIALYQPQTINSGNTVTFEIGAFVITLD